MTSADESNNEGYTDVQWASLVGWASYGLKRTIGIIEMLDERRATQLAKGEPPFKHDERFRAELDTLMATYHEILMHYPPRRTPPPKIAADSDMSETMNG